MTANNMTILNQDNAAEEYAALLKGRYVTTSPSAVTKRQLPSRSTTAPP